MLLVYTIKSIKSTDYALVYKKLIFAGKIPLAYAFDPSGRCVLLKRNEYGGFIVKIDLGKSVEKNINYLPDRLPNLFSRLAENDNKDL